MALQIRKGTEAERTAGGGVVFEVGELIYVTDTDALYIGDGSTAGGVFLTNNAVGTIGDFLVADTIADELKLQKNLNLNSNNIIGTGNITIDGNITATGNIDIGDNTGDTVTITAQVDSNITPTSDTVYDLGSQSLRWRNIFANGATIDGEISAVAINANTVADNSSVMVNVATNEFVGNLTGNVSGDVTGNLTGNVSGNTTGFHTGDVKGSVFGDDSTPLVDSVEGVLRGNHIGTLTGNVLADNGVSILSAGTDGTNANFIGSVQGNITGNVTGNLSGDVTGELTGNVTGNVTGDLKGSVFSDGSTVLVDAVAGAIPGENITGTITASFVGNLQGNVTGDVTGNVTGDVITSSIDSADSSAIIVTPIMQMQADLLVDQSILVGAGNFAGPGSQNVIIKNTGEILTNRITVGEIGTGDPDNIELVIDSTTAFSKPVNFIENISATSDIRVFRLPGGSNVLVVETFTGDIDNDSEIEDPSFYNVHMEVSNTKADFGVPVKFPVVADDTARSTLVPTPEKGMVILMESGTTPSATNQLQYYDGSNWVNV